ncbi:hypothetical protein DMUE_3217 [Dictyocoela muelleri]|nr:hypothetical protein DMUE_3217 [Dictyocoela muelleri]
MGFIYNFHYEKNEKSLGRCQDRRCRGSVVLKNTICINKTEHNHTRNLARNEAEYIRYRCMERSMNTSVRRRVIIASEVGIVSTSINTNLPSNRSFVNIITKNRRR